MAFTSADQDGADIYVIFKDGDDVRQDGLVLQFFNIMQEIWEDNGLDIPLTPSGPAYGCISLGFEVGVIQVRRSPSVRRPPTAQPASAARRRPPPAAATAAAPW